MKQQIEYVETSKLVPYARNSRTHSDEQVAQICGSIKEFGFTNPVLIDADGVIIAGHGRTLAAQRLDMKEVPCLRLDHLTEAQKKAYVIADNKLALNAGWDDEMLALELGELNDLDFDLSLTGFNDDELNALLVEAVEDGLIDEDDAPPPPDDPISKLGDIWQLGSHRVMCGDSTSIDAVDKLMDGNKADLVFTDPPYNIDYGNIKHPKFKQRNIENDNMSRSDFRDFCLSFAGVIESFCDGIIYCWGQPGADGRVMFSVLDEMFHCSTTIVWNKDQFTLGRGKYQNKWEPCWFGWKDSGQAFTDDRKLTNVWDFARPKKSELHPTMKPVEICEYGIRHSSPLRAAVLDLFGGSGSTLIACEKSQRKARLMELDPKYVDVIVRRWQDYTGKQAIHAETGKTFAEMSDV